MIKELTLKPTLYKAAKMLGEESYEDLAFLFGENLDMDEETCKRKLREEGHIRVKTNIDELLAFPVRRDTIIVVEYQNDVPTGVWIAGNEGELRDMFDFEGTI